jgi:hypothetical protein
VTTRWRRSLHCKAVREIKRQEVCGGWIMSKKKEIKNDKINIKEIKFEK